MDSVHANRMRERGRAFVPLIAALLLSFWAGVVSGQVTLEKIVSDNKDAMVFLRTKVTLPTGEVQESTGTGFLLDAEGYVLTASHVLSPAGIYDKSEVSGTIKTRYGQSWPMDVIEDNSRRDLLLLKFKNVDIKWSTVSLGAPTQTPIGAKLFVLGYPLTEDLAAKEGSLSNKNGPGGSWTTTVPLNLGDSGAPVFDDKGSVVAIVVSGVPEARGIAYCLPLNYAASLLSITGVTLATELPAPKPARPRLLSPTDGATLTGFPREVKLDWAQVPGSRSYRLQLEIQHPQTSAWHPHPNALGDRVVGAPPFNLEFIGGQPGRWRVAAISEEGEQGEFSAWSYFTFEDKLDQPMRPSGQLSCSTKRDSFDVSDKLSRASGSVGSHGFYDSAFRSTILTPYAFYKQCFHCGVKGVTFSISATIWGDKAATRGLYVLDMSEVRGEWFSFEAEPGGRVSLKHYRDGRDAVILWTGTHLLQEKSRLTFEAKDGNLIASVDSAEIGRASYDVNLVPDIPLGAGFFVAAGSQVPASAWFDDYEFTACFPT
jgi:hypothetical protein